MNIEYEATFENIDKDEYRQKLKDIGAELIYSEFLQTRIAFFLPKSNEIEGGWIRIRKEKDKNTMSIKIIEGPNIQDQKESCLEIDDFDEAKRFLELIGCEQKAYQETKRELWKLDNVEITIDEWPFLEPFIEIEGSSEKEVKAVSEKLGFDYDKAVFGSVAQLYSKKYKVSLEGINDQTPRIVFDMENPFI